MASELIAEAITDYFGERCLDYAEGCPTCEAWAEYDRIYTRPAPAATDTGLVTVGEVSTVRESIAAFAGHMLSRQLKPGDLLCRRSQAAELLAAERNRAEVAEYKLDQAVNTVQPMIIQRAERAEADNAAQAARIKELSEALDKQRELDNESTLHHYNRAKALEAKLAAAEKALEPFADIADLIDAETEGMAETDELILLFHDYEFAKWPVSFFRKARAVLGGKPS